MALGLLAPAIFTALTWEHDVVFYLLVLAGFGACVVYAEALLSLAGGVAFGFGMLLTSFFTPNPWLMGLAGVGVAVSLANYSRSSSADSDLALEDDPFSERESNRGLEVGNQETGHQPWS